MIFLFILLGIIALLALLVSVPVVVCVSFKDGDIHVGLRYFFVRYTVYPKEQKKKSRLRKYLDGVAAELKKKKRKPASTAQTRPKESSWKRLRRERGFFGAVGYMLRVTLKSVELGAFLVRKAVISRMKIHIAVGGEDAAGTAVAQGQWCAWIYPLVSLLMCSVRRSVQPDINICADFLSAENRYDIDARLRIKPFHGVVGAARLFGSLLKAEVSERQAELSLEALSKSAENKSE